MDNKNEQAPVLVITQPESLQPYNNAEDSYQASFRMKMQADGSGKWESNFRYECLESALKSTNDLCTWLILCEEKIKEIKSKPIKSESTPDYLKYVTGLFLLLQGYAAQHGIKCTMNLDKAIQLYKQAVLQYHNKHAKAFLACLEISRCVIGSDAYASAVNNLITLDKEESVPTIIKMDLARIHCTTAFYKSKSFWKRAETIREGIHYFCDVLNSAKYASTKKDAVNTLFNLISLEKLVDFFFDEAKNIIKGYGPTYYRSVFAIDALKCAANSKMAEGIYCYAQVSHLVSERCGVARYTPLEILVTDADIVQSLYEAACTATTREVAHAALDFLFASYRDKIEDPNMRYKIFRLYCLGSDNVSKDAVKASFYFGDGFAKSANPEVVNLLIADLDKQINELTAEQHLLEEGVHKNFDASQIEQLEAILPFMQESSFTKSFSKLTSDVKSKMEEMKTSIATLINYYTMQKETLQFLDKQNSSSSSTSFTVTQSSVSVAVNSTTSSALTALSSVQHETNVQDDDKKRDVVATYATSPVTPSTTTTNNTNDNKRTLHFPPIVQAQKKAPDYVHYNDL